MSDAKFLLVGHCTPDRFMLQGAISGMIPGAVVEAANDDASALAPGGHVALVNRVLDGAFASTDGIALVEKIAAQGGRAMLISNLDDAQAKAEAAGGLPGFGKSNMRSERAAERLRAAMAVEG